MRPPMHEPTSTKRAVAVLEILLLAPAALFMAALFIRQLAETDAAFAARQIVTWYSGRHWTLWGLLIALPMTVLTIGAYVLSHSRTGDARLRHAGMRGVSGAHADVATVSLVLTTMAAAGMLAIVILHLLAL